MRTRSHAPIAIALGLLVLLMAAPAGALQLEPVGGGFAKPIYVTSPPGDATRLFVVERAGAIKLVEGGDTLPYADLSARVACCEGERGLASMAFDPGYAANRKLYVAYTTKEDTAELDPGDIVIEELTEPASSGDPFGFRRVLSIAHSQFNIHNGGQLQFGPDGYLYLSTGDGGLYDPREFPQITESGLGKILRLDPEPNPPLGYTVPAGNPFAAGSGLAPLVWSMGLRNPFRFSFDRLTGDLAIGDVGEGSREEIDLAFSPTAGVVGGAGDNYGWSCFEGFVLPGLGAGKPFCAGKVPGDFDPPAFEYDHFVPEPGKGIVCSGSVIGGYVARDASLGDLYGRYVYADYCSGDIRSLRLPASQGGLAGDDCSLGLPVDRWNSFGEDAAGRLYVASSKGGVYRFSGPLETCVPDAEEAGAASSQQPVSGEPPQRPQRAIRLLISAQPRLHRGRAAWVSLRAAPCAGQSHRTVRLLRGGRPDGARVLGSDCEARFGRRVDGRATFRGELAATATAPLVRSERLTVRLASPRRSGQ